MCGSSVQTNLNLNRSHTNTAFETWQLGGDLLKQSTFTNLPSPVFLPEHCDTDYVHARNAALHNAIYVQPRGVYIYLTGEMGPELHEIEIRTSDAVLQVRRLHHTFPSTELPFPVIGAPLMPSVVEVPQAQGLEVTPGSDNLGCRTLLVSSGRGDLQLITISDDGVSSNNSGTPPIYPLRLPAPRIGIRPFQFSAALRLPGGDVVAVIWTVKEGKGDRKLSCEIFFATFRMDSNHAPTLEEVGLQRLGGGSPIPPHGCASGKESFVLAMDPGDEDDDDDDEDFGGDNNNSISENSRRRPPRLGGVSKRWDDNDSDLSPRTLAAAASRLQHLTSNEIINNEAPRMHYADVFHETGPDGLGMMGDEPACVLLFYSLQESDILSTPTWVCRRRINCHPHRVLGCQYVQTINGIRLCLTDDVDCAVVDIGYLTCANSRVDTGIAEHEIDFHVTHVSSLPALSYVAAGKLQRKFLLAGDVSASTGIGAALIEAQKYCFLYRNVAVGQVRGDQQVVDVGAAPRDSVLGAAFLRDEADSSPTPVLLILERECLRCYSFV